jgi:hypothetical protein
MYGGPLIEPRRLGRFAEALFISAGAAVSHDRAVLKPWPPLGTALCIRHKLRGIAIPVHDTSGAPSHEKPALASERLKSSGLETRWVNGRRSHNKSKKSYVPAADEQSVRVKCKGAAECDIQWPPSVRGAMAQFGLQSSDSEPAA